MKQLHAIVRGKVQGVSFRYYTRQKAHALGLKGWVRNMSDGTVEVRADGTAQQLQDFVDFLQDGSPAANVDSVDVTYEQSVSGKFSEFKIRYDTGD